MHPRAPERFYVFGSDRFYLSVAAAVLATYVVEAPLRYALHLVSLDSLIYLRDLAIIGCAGSILLSWLRGQVTATLFAFVCSLLAFHTLIGFLHVPALAQPLFGFKQFLPLLLGLALAPLVVRYARAVTRFALACFTLTAAGVIANIWLDYPWVGLTYDTLVGPQELSRQWWASSGLRLPGFTRASYLAAQIMLASAVPLLVLRLGFGKRALLYAVAGLTIWLTTTKGALTGLAALGAADLLLALPGFQPWLGAMLSLMFALCLALPLIGVQLGPTTGRVPEWAASFMERIGDMWPRAFGLFEGPVAVVTGRGLGGIGQGQSFGEAHAFNAADNLMVFLLVTFGVLGPFYLGFVLARLVAFTRQLPVDLPTRWAACWVAVLLGVGMTTGMMEEPVTCLTVGVTLGVVCRSHQPVTAWLFARRATGRGLP